MKIKSISIIALVLAGVLVTVMVLGSSASKTKEYNGYVAAARANAENLVPYTSVMNYRKAFQVKCEDEAIYKEYMEQAKLLGESFYESAVLDYVIYFPESATAYDELCSYYYKTESYKKVIETALKAHELEIATENVRDLYLECYYMYNYIRTEIEEATTFLGNYALVKQGGVYGYITTSGRNLIKPVYESANAFLGDSTAVNDGTEWYMINTGGYKIARPSQKVDYMSFVSNGKILVGKGGKFDYTDPSFKMPETFRYEKASNFKNGIAAVKKDGKWALLNSDMEFKTNFIFEDILLDEYNTCISNNVIFAKTGGKYFMYNPEGKKITEQGFDNAYPFVTNEPAAVCIDNKWGFVDATGKMVIEPKYKEAKSFCCSLAPVTEDGVWGYISSDGTYRIKPTFVDCMPFSANGIAAIKEGEMWSYIKLISF